MYCKGSTLGILYGLPKIHKSDFSTNFQFRSIFAVHNSPSYEITKYLVLFLSNLTTNEYTVDNSNHFVSSFNNFPNAHNLFMASYGVSNLFTNVPLTETINIILDELLFTSPSATFLGLTRTLFKTFLELVVTNSFLI